MGFMDKLEKTVSDVGKKVDVALEKKADEVKGKWDGLDKETKKDIKKGAAGAGGFLLIPGVGGIIAGGYAIKKGVDIYKKNAAKKDYPEKPEE